MARSKDCIICGEVIGTNDGREHLYPAALGCRRKHSGILCKNCNSRFSPLDQLLSEQLSMVNGLIGIRHDRKGEPSRARIRNDETGAEYLVDSWSS